MRAITQFIIAFAALLSVVSGVASAQVVALGASNTAGKGVGTAQAFPAQLQSMLKGTRVTNAGISGNTTGDMLARLNSAVPAGTKVVIVQYGGNDGRKGVAGSRQANIDKIESALAARGIKIVQADGLVRSALQSGLKLSDNQHLTIEGHRQVASGLVSSMP